MKLFFKLFAGVVVALLFSAAFCGAADAHVRFFPRGRVIIAPPPYWYSPWYGPYYYPQPPPPYYQPLDYGWLKTDVEPNDAEVWVDGRWFGRVNDYDGPVNHLRLPLGEHEVEFRAPGYRTFSVGVTITSGDTAVVEYDLRPLLSGPPEVRKGEQDKPGYKDEGKTPREYEDTGGGNDEYEDEDE